MCSETEIWQPWEFEAQLATVGEKAPSEWFGTRLDCVYETCLCVDWRHAIDSSLSLRNGF